jgi:hypothetical protein
MSIRNVFLGSLALLAILIAILLINVTPLFVITESTEEKFIGYFEVRGMAVEYNQKLYTLNYEQQNDAVAYLNQSLLVGPAAKSLASQSTKPEFTRLIIYRFGKPDLVLTPIGWEPDGNLVYSVPEWNHDGLLNDISLGAFRSLISRTYDRL